jgi:signal transduction histidine kinase
MPNGRPDTGATIGDQLDLLTTEIRQLPDLTPQSVLEHACNGLSRIAPFSAAGVFRQNNAGHTLEWVQVPKPETAFLPTFLQQNLSGLTDMLSNNTPAQFGPDNETSSGEGTFVGVSVGQLDGEPTGLALSSTRALDESEIRRLSPFAIMLGLISENARLNKLLVQDGGSDSTARLIGFIAHELRTPLTGMRGNIQLALLATRKGQHERIPKRLELAIGSVDDMSGLVQKLLDVSRLERDSYPLNKSDANLAQTISAALDAVAADEQFVSHSIRVEELDEVIVQHDKPAMQQVFSNLLLSVGHYVDASGEITISTNTTNETAIVRLSYSGTPFSTVDVAALSEPLVNVEASRDSTDDLNLDLAFCRGIICKHRGQITFITDDGTPGAQVIEVTIPR